MSFPNGQLPSFKDIFNYFVDALNKFLLVILIVLLILTIFIRTFILDVIKFVLLGIIIFRLASKNKQQRYKENQTFLKIVHSIFKPFKNLKRNLSDRNKYVYKKCSKCKTTLKLPLPKKRGINHAKCPNCNKRITLISLRKQKKEKIKVEVIKKKK